MQLKGEKSLLKMALALKNSAGLKTLPHILIMESSMPVRRDCLMLPIHVDISKVFFFHLEEKLHEFHTCRVALKMNFDKKRKIL